MEIIRTKREYNTRKNQLLLAGFTQGWTSENGTTAVFYNFSTVTRVILKQGWKRG